MSIAPKPERVEVEAYLAGESVAKLRHEYVDGNVYAMVGGTNAHNLIATNLVGLLHNQLRGKPCAFYNSDTKVRIRSGQSTRFYYPDAMVVCEPNPSTDAFQDSPTAVFEVLSDSTRRTDEHEKRDAYLSIASLNTYLLFEQTTASAVIYQRSEDQFQRSNVNGMEGTIALLTANCQLVLRDVYEGIDCR